MQIEQLRVSLLQEKKQLIAVDTISFALKAGETLALLGESGCGKSLTALAILRLLPMGAAYGMQSRVMLNEQDVLSLPESLMRQLRGRRLSIIFQEPMTALNPVLRIERQLAEAIEGYQQYSAAALKQKMIALLEEVEIDKPALRLRQYPHQLSGGLKQRILIAMALANDPEILIADEPTTALDVTIQAQILTLLKKLQQQHHMSMLLITHDLGVVKAMADRVCVMYAGQLVESAAVEDFFQQVKHPYAQQLLLSMPSLAKREEKLSVIKGAVPTLDALPPACRFQPRCPHAFSRCEQEMPLLQIVDKHEVRCHLYPQHTALPEIHDVKQMWPERTEDNTIILRAEDLTVHFALGGHLFKKPEAVIKAVDGLSFELYRGRTLALVGESGCGKTTVGRSLLGLQTLNKGKIYYQGVELTQLNAKQRRHYRKNIQIVFQDPFSSLNPRMCVGDILAEGLLAQGMHRKDIEKKQSMLLEQVNLPRNCLSRYPHQFSGGQRQRISIARALALEPQILICDEPTSALDISVQAQILNLLKTLQYELGISYLFITHNMAVVSYIADDVLVMQHGKMVEKGSVQEVLNHPAQAYTQRLLASVLVV